MPNEFENTDQIKLIEEVSTKINKLNVIKDDVQQGNIISTQIESDLLDLNCLSLFENLRAKAGEIAIKLLNEQIKKDTAHLTNLHSKRRTQSDN